jgi:diguanylate cyclase
MSSRDPDYTRKIGELAMEKIRSLGLPAHPADYELWYTYSAGSNPDLNRRINRALEANVSLSITELDGIYVEYLGSTQSSAESAEIGDSISDEINKVVEMIGELAQSTSEGRANFADASKQLDDACSATGAQSIVGALIKFLREVEHKWTNLEERLSMSSQEMDSLKKALAAVTVEANVDSVTGLFSRRRFDAALEHAIEHAKVGGQALTLLMIDVDHFKRFNDRHGHLMGDSVLGLIGATLKESIKGQDTAGRYGGEEFAVILPNTALSDAAALADQIRKKIATRELRVRSNGVRLGTVTISIGVAEYRVGEGPTSLIERADLCLYTAKRAGRNCTWKESVQAEIPENVA